MPAGVNGVALQRYRSESSAHSDSVAAGLVFPIETCACSEAKHGAPSTSPPSRKECDNIRRTNESCPLVRSLNFAPNCENSRVLVIRLPRTTIVSGRDSLARSNQIHPMLQPVIE
jgi:hypothetical protein